jgi:hypothetical protein
MSYRSGRVQFEAPAGWTDLSLVSLVAAKREGFREAIVISWQPQAPATLAAWVDRAKKEYRAHGDAAFVGAHEASVSGSAAAILEIKRTVAPGSAQGVGELRHVVALCPGEQPLIVTGTWPETRAAEGWPALRTFLAGLRRDGKGTTVHGRLGLEAPARWLLDAHARLRRDEGPGTSGQLIDVWHTPYGRPAAEHVEEMRRVQTQAGGDIQLEPPRQLDTGMGSWTVWSGSRKDKPRARATAKSVSLRSAPPKAQVAAASPDSHQAVAVLVRDRTAFTVTVSGAEPTEVTARHQELLKTLSLTR